MATQILTCGLKSLFLQNIKSRTIPIVSSFKSNLKYSTAAVPGTSHLSYYVKDGVGVIVYDSPGRANVLNENSMTDLKAALEALLKDSQVSSIVLRSAKKDCFIAGADISMLKACGTKEKTEQLSKGGQQTLKLLENSNKPVVSAIMGSCLGGGLETALATHYRIAVMNKSTQLGVPEVKLGLLPGAGGTQRLLKTISIDQALDLMLTGKSLNAEKAKRIGLVDHVVQSLGPGLHAPDDGTLLYLEEVAIQCAKDLASGKLKKTPRKIALQEKLISAMLKFEFGRNFFFDKVKQKVLKSTKGLYPAPLKIIEVVKKSVEKGEEVGYELEAKAFGELGVSMESKGLIGLFDGMTACKKNRFGKPQRPVKHLAVLGAGLMGAGIAQVTIDKNIDVIMKDVSINSLSKGQQQIEKGLKDAVKKRKITQFESDKIYSRLNSTLTYDDFKNSDMVIEAVFEDIGVKHKVIREIEQHVPDYCIVATNTSALSIAKIAEASKRPEKIIGMHYFSPVDKMMLLELVTYDKTSNDTIASAVDVGLKQGKIVITVKDSPGFYTTRCLMALGSEAFEILLEGMNPRELDQATVKMGFPVGSVTLMDEVGIDVAAHISAYLADALGDRLGLNKQDAILFNEMVNKGFLGRKSKRGVYVYEDGSKNREVNEGFLKLVKKFSKPAKIPLTPEDIRLRTLGRFANQCILCLQEGILANPLEGDMGAVFGLGFPPFLGGPFRFADVYGADKLVSGLQRLADIHGERLRPCQLLLDYAKEPSKKFHAS
ncbi:hypothetical protein HELRODRAFT_194454 [Helobdella robusta]|uniref:Trifunctional enzyme subunit alpha, mitochondrial n=1 Tax=Helobdella robusta TaxID=6412 RepID=T1FW26_HELRO|nr:hypothetical protein HELRODRAFT_194454 [Helobdella robusta]ESN91955.1 hypothetical protein HELRODRAFT_194454 [Helobdella robusta]